MATGNFSLVANSTFQPFTYQELVAPVAHQQQVQDALQEQYDKISSQADILEAMGANENDRNSNSYSKFRSYSDALRKEADDLYRFGLNSESRQRLSDIRRKYNQEIVPIQNAWNKREQEAAMQMQASMQNPSLMYTRDARNTTLDEYVRNPTGGFGVINGNNIMAQMGTMAANLAKQVRSGNKENIDEYTYKYIEKYGLDANLIRDWRNNPTLKTMFEQVMKSNGVTPEALEGSLNAQNIINQSTGYAEMGMWNAIGQDKTQVLENFESRLNAQAAKEIAVNRAKLYDTAAAAAAGAESELPQWGEERAGIKTSDGYVTNAPEVVGSLKGGNDGFKASYFGNRLGQVNPLAIYEEYQEERKKHTKRQLVEEEGTTKVKNVTDEDAAKKAILSKYGKYGVSNVLSTQQYDILKGMGYNNKSTFSKFSDIENGLDKLAVQNTRYSTKMAGYDIPDESIRTNILRMTDQQFRSGMMWDLNDDGSVGSPVRNKKSLKLKTNSDSKGNEVADIQYDPQHKTKVLVTFSDGSRKIASPDIIDAQLTKAIHRWENDGYDPRVITGMISKWLNTYNKQQSKTSSKE